MWKLKAHYIFQDEAQFYWMGLDGMYAVYRKTGVRYWFARLFKRKLDYIRKL